MTKDEIGLTNYFVTKIANVLRVCDNAFLSQNVDTTNVDMVILTENLNNKRLNGNDIENKNNATDKNNALLNP